MLTEAQRKQWDEDGFLHLPGFFSPADALVAWTEEMMGWPETPGQVMKYFEPAFDDSNPRMLCRMEYFLDYHPGWREVIYDARLLAILAELFGEPAVLYKEKINVKLPKASGFTAHQDAPAFATFGQTWHITAMISLDASTPENGCLEMARGRHREGLLEMARDKSLSDAVIAALRWEALPTAPGDLVLFGSFIPHRSGSNRSTGPRKAAYITYNGASQGMHRDDYYRHKREVFPPECERIPGKDYSDSGLYNIGNPIRM